mmetsp:Transcript_7085/g.10580  ORF Transcript_7085/g.10580 Transcript_7085/m.10580 type:complete len:185 (-) Transcript_7085:301-855(-)
MKSFGAMVVKRRSLVLIQHTIFTQRRSLSVSPPPKPTHKWYSPTPAIARLIRHSGVTDDDDVINFAAKSCTVGLFSIGAISVLGTCGVDTTPIVAGISVTGFTVGFALKEIATNFLSGILLVFHKPFRKGQYLRVMVASQVLEGTVESIDIRYVLLKNDGKTLMIPSAVVYGNPILIGPSVREH